MSYEIFTLENEAFKHFAIASSILVFKMLAMAPFTARYRFGTKTFSNPEDNGKKSVGKNEDVERVRRSHRNDLENILPYLSIGLLYLATKPDPTTAAYHFYTFTAARIIYTIAYGFGLQPWRSLFWGVGYIDTLYLAGRVLFTAFKHH